MITTVKIVRAHAKALYWKNRMAACDRYMRKNLKTLATLGSGQHETEYGFFTVSENNSYPADRIRAQLSAKDIDMCMEKKWSQERAKILFPIAYQNAKQQNGYKVSL